MESTQPESQHPAVALIQERRGKAQRPWKIAIRSAATVFAIVALGLQIKIAIPRTRSTDDDYGYGYYYYYYSNSWFSPESFALLGLSIVWNCAEFITICINKRGIHPGAHVGLDLVIWSGLLSAGVIQLLLDFWLPIAIAAASVKFVCCILHFILFVWACVDTDRRRKFQNAEFLSQITAALQQQGQSQQTQQRPVSNFAGSAMGAPSVPPGMALVPIEMLAHMKQPQPTEQSYPAVPNA